MTWVAVGVGGAALVGAVAGAYISSQGAKDAAETQAKAAQQASQNQLLMYYQNRQDMMPWIQAGGGALGLLQSVLYAGPGGSPGSFPVQNYQPTNFLGGGGGGAYAPGGISQPGAGTPIGGWPAWTYPYEPGVTPSAPVGFGSPPTIQPSPVPPGYGQPAVVPQQPGLPSYSNIMGQWVPTPPELQGAQGFSPYGYWQPDPYNETGGYTWVTLPPPASQPSNALQGPTAPAGAPVSQPGSYANIPGSIKVNLEGQASAPYPAVTLPTAGILPVGGVPQAGQGGGTPSANLDLSPGYTLVGGQPVYIGQGGGEPATAAGGTWGDWTSRYTASPFYNFLLAEGVKGLERGAAAKGQLLGGAEQKALVQYGQNIGLGGYEQWLNDWYKSLTPLQSLAGVGMTGTNIVGNWGQSTAGQVGQNMLAAGQAQAAGQYGQAQTWSNLANWGAQQGLNYLAKNYQAPAAQPAGGDFMYPNNYLVSSQI